MTGDGPNGHDTLPESAFDIVYVIEARFEGGVSTAVATELDDLLFQTNPPLVGIVLIKAHLLGLPWPVHPGIRKHITSGQLRVLRPTERWTTQIALVHHPVVFANLPREPLPVRAERAILVLHHPLFDNGGKRQYDLEEVESNILATLSKECFIAPVSPVVRRSLRRHIPKSGIVVDEDWLNVIEPADWPFDTTRPAPDPDHIVIGRHARPDRLKWPDTRAEAEQIYGANRSDVEIRILGGGPFLDMLYTAPLPENWIQHPFDSEGVAAFLSGLDFYVYYHATDWSEAFGRTILEALACGLVTILPPHFEEMFGAAALYAKPADVMDLIDTFVADPDAYHRQRRAARTWVMRHHAAAYRATDRVKLYGLRDRTRDAPPATPELNGKARANVLFLSTNGIGVGHLTQQLAIADRLPQDTVQAVFVSMSFSLKVARDAGYPTFYLPHHKHLGAGHEQWNDILAEELFDLIRNLQPRLVAYDGTAVFGGVAAAPDEFPDMLSLWVRRAMWRECHRGFVGMHTHFSGVIEPGELAGDLDHGPTKDMIDYVHVTEPVLHIDPAARTPRAAARAHYGLSDRDLVVALQLGSGANFDTAQLRRDAIQALLRDPRVRILEIVSPLAPMPDPVRSAGDRLVQLREFPSFLNSTALDAAVGVAGYNSFHEQIYGGIPTLFIPNEAPEMDSQLTRAQWANVMGMGLCLRARHVGSGLGDAIAHLLDDTQRAHMRAVMAELPTPKGAAEVAAIVADYSAMIRTDRWPFDAYLR